MKVRYNADEPVTADHGLILFVLAVTMLNMFLYLLLAYFIDQLFIAGVAGTIMLVTASIISNKVLK